MKDKLILQKQSGEKFSLEPTNLTKNEPYSQVQETVPNYSWGMTEGIFFVLIGVSFIPLLLMFIRSLNLYKTISSRLTLHQGTQQSTCLKCQYFSKNMYLKCAVNPSIVLTKEAKDCPDFCSK